MNCFCGIIDQRNAFTLICSWDHCQRSSSSRISGTPRAGFIQKIKFVQKIKRIHSKLKINSLKNFNEFIQKTKAGIFLKCF